MIFRQILHPQTGCASYFFGCTGRREIAVCDPHLEHVDEYLALTQDIGIPIGHIFETHVQADHRSGASPLAARTGAKVYLHESSEVDFPHVALRDNDEIPLGNDFVRVLHTPGHSLDSMCFVVGDGTRGPDPWFVLTGDTLFVGDVGRPDLHDPGDAMPLAAQLYDSLWQKLMTLNDAVEVYPAHFAGSACGRSMSAKPSSTIGFERRYNPALQIRSREEFTVYALRDLPPPPADFAAIHHQNFTGLVKRRGSKEEWR